MESLSGDKVAKMVSEYMGFIADKDQEIQSLKSRLDKEHENFLAVHRDNMRAVGRIAELKSIIDEAERALEKYADKKMWSKAVLDSQCGECNIFDWANIPLNYDNGYEIAENALAKIKKMKGGK